MPNIDRLLDAKKRAEGCLEIAEQEIEIIRIGLDSDLDPVVRADLLQSLAGYEALVAQYAARIRWCSVEIDRMAVAA